MNRNAKTTVARPGFAGWIPGRLIALTLVSLSLPGLLPAQSLQHRYSFATDASDSVGTANGTIVAPTTGAPATIANGLNLPGAPGGFGTSGYVSLPPGMLVGNTSLTVECWATQNQGNGWAEIWDFAIDTSHNFGLIPQPVNNNGNVEVAFTPHGNEVDLQSASPFPTGVEQYVVVTYNNSTLVANLYTNGILDATTTLPDTTYSPGTFGGATGTTEDMLGNDVYGDAQFSGTVYEFRIWNGVVSQRYIAASAIVGPGVIVNNLTPTSATLTAGPSVLVTGTEQATVTVELSATGTNELVATGDATNWISTNPNVLAVNSHGVISGVSPGTATVKATVGGVTCTSGSITVSPFSLEHRYSFVSDATDSIGGADGTLVPNGGGTDATIANGLSLPGGGGGGFSGYLSLPSGILDDTTSLTIECWLTQNQGNTWATPWDFANNGNQNFGLITKPGNNNGHMEVAFTPNGNERDLQSATVFPNGSEQYVAVTYNNFSLAANLYLNGAIDATTTLPNTGYAPGGFGGGLTVNALGNDIYNDAQFQGTIYEFRIWNGAVSPAYVAVSAVAGPSVIVTNVTPQSLALSVNTSMIGSGTQQAVATGNFAQASGVDVTDAAVNWTSSNPTILTVNSSGLITAINGGTATVSATVNGVTATSATITVATTAPVFTHGPSNITVVVGESGTFNTVAVGGNLTYQWSYGSNPIPDATNATLTVTNVTYASAGTYSVTAVNNLGSATASATLTVVRSVLAHRYSFVTDATDSIGGANGTINPPTTGAPATIANGLSLPGSPGGFGTSGYVSLPTGLLVGYNSITLECWVTQTQGNTWAEIWDFGNNGSQNFGLIPFPANNGNNMEVAFTPNGGERDVQSISAFPNGVEQYVVVTYDDASLVANLYTNGVLDATTTLPNPTYSPGRIGGAGGTGENMLGNDVYGDAQFSGTVYEFRIWNGAVSQSYIAASAVAGPGVVVNNLTPTSATLTAGPSVVVTGTEQSTVTVQLAQTGTNELIVTGDATNWVSANPAVLAVNSHGLITGVAPGTTTVSATVSGVTSTSGPITVKPFSLEHRYSFASDASDSIGGADGTLVPNNGGTDASINNGLVLPGGGGGGFSGYLTLPSGILTDTTSLTVECWVTQNQANTWATPWDFGNNGNQNFELCTKPGNNNGNMEAAFTPHGGEIDLQSAVLFPNGSEQYVALTYNNYSLVADLYTNGVLVATHTYPDTTYCPGSIGGAGGTALNALGNNVYGDPQFQGTIYEFRIWNGSVSPVYLAVSAAAGPGVVVTNTTPVSVGVAAGASLTSGQTEQASVTGAFTEASGITVTGSATNWTSSNPSVLTVSSSGLITAVGPGSATVSATVNGVTGTSASITVTANLIGISQSAGSITLTWQNGILLQAPTVLGPWTTNTTAVSPFTFVPATSGNEFYRVQVGH